MVKIDTDVNSNLLCTWVVFCPYSNKLVQMVSAQNGRVTGEVIKVVHDDSNEQVQHEEGAKENEGHKIGVGHLGSASFFGI